MSGEAVYSSIGLILSAATIAALIGWRDKVSFYDPHDLFGMIMACIGIAVIGWVVWPIYIPIGAGMFIHAQRERQREKADAELAERTRADKLLKEEGIL